MKIALHLLFALALASTSLGSPVQDTPPCETPAPGDECSIICTATRATQVDEGTGTPAQKAALLAHVDITVTFVFGPNTICNGNAKTVDGGCVTCQQCWTDVTASWSQHTQNVPGWVWRPVLPGTTGGWSSTSPFTRDGFLRANCGGFDSFRIEVAITGATSQIIFTKGITMTCGGC